MIIVEQVLFDDELWRLAVLVVKFFGIRFILLELLHFLAGQLRSVDVLKFIDALSDDFEAHVCHFDNLARRPSEPVELRSNQDGCPADATWMTTARDP